MAPPPPPPSPAAAAVAILLFTLFSSALSIGVNYGTLGDNLPPPAQVAAFLRDRTIIDRVKIFDANPDIIRAFAGTGISVTISVPNGDVHSLTKARAARHWVTNNIVPFYPATNISLVLLGNEVLLSNDQNLIASVGPAMRTLHAALVRAKFRGIRVSTPHALNIIPPAPFPSAGVFVPGWDKDVIAPMLSYHRKSKSPFVVNPYPYFSYNGATLDYALFRPNAGVFDPATRITYTNFFDALMDTVYTAMKKLGYPDVEIVIGETGWPSAAEPGQLGVSVADAAQYNGNLIKKVNDGLGTPLMPGRKFETYIFALFNEDLKPGPNAERHWGLFNPDFTPVYDVGILRGGGGPTPIPTPTPTPGPGTGGTWCVPKAGVAEAALQANVDWVCSNGGVNCAAIQPNGACFEPNTVQNHAAFVMNAYYQGSAKQPSNCDFTGTGVLTSTDPSYGACKFSS